MTTPTRRLLIASLLAVLAPALSAQTVPPAPIPPPAATEDLIELSPFHVSSSKDVGYTATNALAGTRLNTPQRDVGTTVSVITKEFLLDIAANDSSTLLPYAVSTEVGGLDGNFAGGSMAGGRNEQGGARTEPERNQRVRGLASAELTRDFYLSDIPFDS
jgi:hypothetical protein